MARQEYRPAPGDFSTNADGKRRMEEARAAQRRIEHPLTVEVHRKEVEIPDGGGKGTEVPYQLTVKIFGAPAFTLRRDNFKSTGQMNDLIEIIQALKPKTDDAKK